MPMPSAAAPTPAAPATPSCWTWTYRCPQPVRSTNRRASRPNSKRLVHGPCSISVRADRALAPALRVRRLRRHHQVDRTNIGGTQVSRSLWASRHPHVGRQKTRHRQSPLAEGDGVGRRLCPCCCPRPARSLQPRRSRTRRSWTKQSHCRAGERTWVEEPQLQLSRRASHANAVSIMPQELWLRLI